MADFQETSVLLSDYVRNSHEGAFPPAKDFPDLQKHNNYLKDHLTPAVYTKYRDWETPNGWRLDQCIQTGIDNPGAPDQHMKIGIVACDGDCYDTYKDIFYPVLMERHNGYDAATQTHPCNMEATSIRNGEFDSDYVLSCRIRAARSIAGFSNPPVCSRAERRRVEKICKEIFLEMEGDLKGEYHPLTDFSEGQYERMLYCHKLFDKPLHAVHPGVVRDWPDARGIFYNRKRNFLVWVNEEDHLRIISMQKGGDMKTVFERLCKGASKMEETANEKGWEYQKSSNLGYIVACPSNVGNGIRCSVHVKLPLLSNTNDFDDKLWELRLQKRGLDGNVDTKVTDGIYDISNLDRLGKSATHVVQEVCDGVTELIRLEKQLE